MPDPTTLSVEEAAVAPPPATFGLRTLAKLVDLLVLNAFQLVLFLLLTFLDALGVAGVGTIAALLTAYVLLSLVYFAAFSVLGGQTWGYRLAGLRVMTIEGQALGVSRAVARTVVDLVSLSLLGYMVGVLDYLPVALTRSKQAGHDLLTRTMVVRVAPPRSGPLAAGVAFSIAAPFVIVFGIIRPFFLQAFYTPSPSMLPTLQVNDRFLANKLVLHLRPLHRGDLVVFAAPERVMPGSPDFVKRVGGLPGDVVRTVRGRVLVDGHEYNHAAVRDGLGRVGIFGQDALSDAVDQAVHHVRFVAGGVMADGRLVPKDRLGNLLTGQAKAAVSVLPGYVLYNGRRVDEPFAAEDPDYDLRFTQGQPLRHRYDSDQADDEYSLGERAVTKDEYGKAGAAADERVPPGQILVYGDNRNDSHDSAYWGFLPQSAVEGEVTLRFFPDWRRLH